ncbi:hypothetical protein L9F63_018147, partial [Diploptera punctata]
FRSCISIISSLSSIGVMLFPGDLIIENRIGQTVILIEEYKILMLWRFGHNFIFFH